MKAFLKRMGKDFVNVGIFQTYEECLERVKECRGNWDYSLSFSSNTDLEFPKNAEYKTYETKEGIELYLEVIIHR